MKSGPVSAKFAVNHACGPPSDCDSTSAPCTWVEIGTPVVVAARGIVGSYA
jgi:hypothetical protein